LKPDDRIRLSHILDALGYAVLFTAERHREDLDSDVMLRFALLYAIQIVGEAASRISPETRDQYPAVPWPVIVAMRNRLVHVYADIDHDILWTTATEAVPQLLAQLQGILDED
jgi:uncharacterized protein with HEPN domain